jgi:hypothetical protein
VQKLIKTLFKIEQDDFINSIVQVQAQLQLIPKEFQKLLINHKIAPLLILSNWYGIT